MFAALLIFAVLVAWFLPVYGIRAHLKAQPQHQAFFAGLDAQELSIGKRVADRARKFWIEITGFVGLVAATIFDPETITGLLHIDFSAWFGRRA